MLSGFLFLSTCLPWNLDNHRFLWQLLLGQRIPLQYLCYRHVKHERRTNRLTVYLTHVMGASHAWRVPAQ